MSPFYCGIDFGTSNSSIAVVSPQTAPRLVTLENNSTAVPSSIFYSFGQLPLFGNAAVKAYISGREGRLMRSLKRVLGTDLMSSGTILNGKIVKFENVLAQYIGYLKSRAEAEIGQEITSVVMGRPVHFRDGDNEGDRRAEQELGAIAKSVGFKNIVFQYEPIAAAFAHETSVIGEKLACVIDIGGGTSDFTVIRIGSTLSAKTDRSGDILASTGVRIGGNDFDRDLAVAAFMPPLGLRSTHGAKNLPVPSSQYYDLAEWSKVNSVYTYANRKMIQSVLLNAHRPDLYRRLLEVVEREKGHELLGQVEQAKINLTDSEKITTVLKFLTESPEICVTRRQFEQAVDQNISKTVQTMQECLKQAGIKATQIELAILTGGSTFIPAVQKTLCGCFPHAAVSSADKLCSVGLGLAYDSLRRFA